MNFKQLEEIGQGLFGFSWKAQLAKAFGIDRRNVTAWKKQGVATWVDAEIEKVITERKEQLLAAENTYQQIKLNKTED